MEGQQRPACSLTCSMWNITSIVNKTEVMMEHLLDRNPEIVFLSETWMKADKDNVTALVKTYGYTLVHNRRKNRQKEIGGGVGFLLNSRLEYKRINQKSFSSFEHMTIKLTMEHGSCLTLVSIYRVLFVSVIIFLEEIVELFQILLSLPGNIVIAGDINIHIDEDERYSNRFKDILQTFNITQHINFPTHIQGHTLDAVFTFSEDPRITNLSSEVHDISHHFLVNFDMDIVPVKRLSKVISFRDIKNLNLDQISNDIAEKLHIFEEISFKDNINNYNSVLKNVLDEQAPLKSRNIKIVPDAPWFDGEYASLRKRRRKAEKLYRKTGSALHRENFVSLRKQTTVLAWKKKHSYYSNKLNVGGNKIMYSIVNKLLDKDQEVVLPNTDNNEELANGFLKFFTEKIDKLRMKFSKTDISSLVTEVDVNQKLLAFQETTTDEILQIVHSYSIKCSPDDPFPATLLKQNLDFFIPIWKKMVNISLSQGSMDCLKGAILKPLIKDLDEHIDHENFKNYRPVSNLAFIGKLVERVVSIRLNKHMLDNKLHIDSQYGYKKGHSTETLLLKLMNNLFNACDDHLPSVLMLLDLSAAFDTVDQDKLLMILRQEIGIDGVALKWFSSFLKDRTQMVQVGKSHSSVSPLKFGVPQGSVLGPDLFNIYIRSLCKYIEQTTFIPFGFADDHQLCKSFQPVFQLTVLGDDIRSCFESISKWMNEYFLCLNTGKTKILVVAPPFIQDSILIHGLFLNNKCVRFVNSAKNLGVILDNELSFAPQIMKVVQSCFMVIRNLWKIKSYLSFEDLKTVISACVFSKIDYCNSLYFGVNSYLLTKLQSVQNSAARLLRTKNGSNLSLDQFIRKCHWLKVKDRIIFKVCLIVHKCLYGLAPDSLKELLSYGSSSRTMKLIQHAHKGSFGERCFSRVGPKIWNLLPINIRMERKCDAFKTLLKTYLFNNSDYLSEKLVER